MQFEGLLKQISDSPYSQVSVIILTILSFLFGSIINITMMQGNALLSYLSIFVSLVLSIILISSYLYFKKNRIPIIRRSFFVDYYLEKYIENSKISVQFVCIFMKNWESIKKIIFEKMRKNHDFIVEIYIVKRKRKPEETSYLKLRQEDEYINNDFISSMNKNLYDIFLELIKYELSEKINIRKFQVKEYEFMPTVSIYIFDKKRLVFGPYIAKSCDNIPLIEIISGVKNESFSDPHNDVISAFENLREHFRILSGNIRRKNKKYPRRFSYWDGYYNVPIHSLIKLYSRELIPLTNETNSQLYSDFLDAKNDLYKDEIMEALCEDRDEGRFDALMRNISDCLSVNLNGQPNQGDLEDLEVILSMAIRSGSKILKNEDRIRHIDRLKNIISRINAMQQWMDGELSYDWRERIMSFQESVNVFINQLAEINKNPVSYNDQLRKSLPQLYLKKMKDRRKEIIDNIEEGIIANIR